MSKIDPKFINGSDNTYAGEAYFKSDDGLSMITKPIQEAFDFNIDDVIKVVDDGLGNKIFQGFPFSDFTQVVNEDFTDITYADLVIAIGANTLVVNAMYRISDFATVHEMYDNDTVISGATHTCATEPLIVRAIASNALSPIAFSQTHPEDIIFYDYNNNQTAVPGCQYGYIYRRIDTIRDIDLWLDWRNVTFRRWAINVTSTYDSGTSYSKGNIVIYGSNLWVSIENSNVGHTPVGDNTDNYWYQFPFNNGDYAVWKSTTLVIAGHGKSSTTWGITIPVSAAYQDYNIFFNATSHVKINLILSDVGSTNLIATNNMVFRSSTNNINVSSITKFTSSYILDSIFGTGINQGSIIATLVGAFTTSTVDNISNAVIGYSGLSGLLNANIGSSHIGNGYGWVFDTNGVCISGCIVGNSVHDLQFRCVVGADITIGTTTCYNIFEGGKNVNTIDLSVGTLVKDQTIFCHIYSRPDGAVKLYYFNDSDAMVVANADA